MIHYKTLISSDAEPYVEELSSLRMTVFHEFPYLYEGSLSYESAYLARYFKSKQSFVVLCFDDDIIVGAATGLPLEEESEQVRTLFNKHGFNPSQVFYFGESVLRPKYRGQGIGKAFFKFRLDHALSLPQMTHASFCAVIRPPDHPMRPQNYVPHDAFWTKQGFNKVPGLVTTFTWRDIGNDAEDEKAMQFWTKCIR